jgi:uncharacterized protein (UPF0332 family)
MDYTMVEEKKLFITSFLNKSKEALEDARINLENVRLANALNRIYYAIFYSVVALGYLENFITSKHKQLMGWFNRKFIHEEKIFDQNLYDTYKEAFENRQESDYTIYSVLDTEEIRINYENAVVFVKKISEYIVANIKD